MTNNCRGCGASLTPDNDSDAHVIPNALGGRLARKGIICQACNTKLDRVADNALVEAFGDWPTLLDIPRQRGANPPKIIETKGGERVRMNADGSSTKLGVQYDVTKTAEGQLVEIGAGNIKTLRQLLARAAKEFPQFDAKAAEAHARTIGVLEDDPLRIRFDFSPQGCFGGIVTAIWLYLIIETDRAFMDMKQLLDCIDTVQQRGGTWRYLPEGLPGLQGPDIELGHKLVVRAVPHSGELIAYAEIFGILKVGGVFARSPNPGYELEHIYAFDVLNTSDRSQDFSIDCDEFDGQDWKAVGLGPTDSKALQTHFRQEFERFVTLYERRFSEDT